MSNSAPPFYELYVNDFKVSSLGDIASFDEPGSTSRDVLELMLSCRAFIEGNDTLIESYITSVPNLTFTRQNQML